MPNSSALQRLVLLAIVFAAFVVVGEAQQQEPAEPTGPEVPETSESVLTGTNNSQPDGREVFRSGINFVRVDVTVTDEDGNHVSDLQASDFEVYEDGGLQSIESFELIDPTRATGRPGERMRCERLFGHSP